MYNECETNNFFLIAKNPCTMHNIYQYINREQTKHIHKTKKLHKQEKFFLNKIKNKKQQGKMTK
jgi:hypothetical protein